MKSLTFISIFFLNSIFFSCASLKDNSTEDRLNFISAYTIPNKKVFDETVIGGLSGIDYDKQNEFFYFISDDRGKYGPSRFYKAKIHFGKNKIDDIEFLKVIFLKNEKGEMFGNVEDAFKESVDPEDIRINADGRFLFWTDEGERIVNSDTVVLKNPGIYRMKSNGLYVDSLKIPDNLKMRAYEKGPRRNGTFEGLSFGKDFNKLYVSVEDPLFEDGNIATINQGALSRILEFDLKTNEVIAQYAYRLEKVAERPIGDVKVGNNGISAILNAGPEKLYVVERSYSREKGNAIKVFLCDLSLATNVQDFPSLVKRQDTFSTISKKKMLDTRNLDIVIDNVEGVSYGPVLPNGNKTLVFVTDDNFSAEQKTQILIFEIEKN